MKPHVSENDSFCSKLSGITYTVIEEFEDIVVVAHDEPIESPIGGKVIEVGDPVELHKSEWDALKQNCLKQNCT